jgi:hypothetical protein
VPEGRDGLPHSVSTPSAERCWRQLNPDRHDNPYNHSQLFRAVYRGLVPATIVGASTRAGPGIRRSLPLRNGRTRRPASKEKEARDDSADVEVRVERPAGGDDRFFWYERSYNSRVLRYLASDRRLALPIAMETEDGLFRAELDNFEVASRLEANLYLNYLLLTGHDGYGYKARLYELSEGKLIWSSGGDTHVCFWPRRRSPPTYSLPEADTRGQ